jgi:hypothetical protein
MEIDREKIKKQILATGKVKPKELKIFYKVRGNKLPFTIDDFFSNGKTIKEGKQKLLRTLNDVCKKLQTNNDNVFVGDGLYQRNIIFYKKTIESNEAVEKRLDRMVDKEIKRIQLNENKRKTKKKQLIKEAEKLIDVLGEDVYEVFAKIIKNKKDER